LNEGLFLAILYKVVLDWFSQGNLFIKLVVIAIRLQTFTIALSKSIICVRTEHHRRLF